MCKLYKEYKGCGVNHLQVVEKALRMLRQAQHERILINNINAYRSL